MPLTLELPDQYGLVLAAATSTFFVNAIHMGRTAKFRKASGIQYPNSYATAEEADKSPTAYKFNCAQRAHANYTESHTSLLGALLIAGLHFPSVAAAFGAIWAVSRVVYLYGYTSSAGPKGRMVGSLGGFISDIALKIMAVYTSFLIATGK